jgi:hypothetical protein
MNEIRPEHVINGSYGEAWLDGDYLAEIKGLEAKIAIEYEDIDRPRKLGKGKKMIGYEGTGTLKLNKVTSRFIKLLSDNLKQGKQTSFTVISKLDDPDALGAERIMIKNVTLEELTLANWEAKTTGEEEIPFSFDDWEPMDLIDE